MDDEEMEEFNSNKDFDIEYDPLVAAIAAAAGSGDVGDENISIVQSKSFMFTQGWDSEMIVDHRINEEEFHNISFMHCHFFIRKSSDPNSDVYDFKEMYVTPPDTDVYVVPKVLTPSNASKDFDLACSFSQSANSDYGCYNVIEPPIDAPRDPLYKSEKEVLKVSPRYVRIEVASIVIQSDVFLTKHFKNQRLWDPEFVLDFEKIYVIDSKTKSITRAKVLGQEKRLARSLGQWKLFQDHPF
ncbi:hypothetical protein Csa_023109, partial [Cucumis sativus]